MAVSPAPLVAAVAGVAGLVRRLDLSPRALRYEAWLASGAAAADDRLPGRCLLLGARRGLRGRAFFTPGAIDAASLAVMMLALFMARRATGLARKSALSSRPHVSRGAQPSCVSRA